MVASTWTKCLLANMVLLLGTASALREVNWLPRGYRLGDQPLGFIKAFKDCKQNGGTLAGWILDEAAVRGLLTRGSGGAVWDGSGITSGQCTARYPGEPRPVGEDCKPAKQYACRMQVNFPAPDFPDYPPAPNHPAAPTIRTGPAPNPSPIRVTPSPRVPRVNPPKQTPNPFNRFPSPIRPSKRAPSPRRRAPSPMVDWEFGWEWEGEWEWFPIP